MVERNIYATVPPDDVLVEFMVEIGIPQEQLGIYKEFVKSEYEFRRNPERATSKDFFGAHDQAIVEQNERIKTLRALMETTEKGRLKIIQMSENGIGNETTIPFPVPNI
jgi:hypothetical protein